METFSLTDIKKKNLYDVYHYIYMNPGCSKQSIANALTISLPTVSQHLATLLEQGLIEKCGQLASQVGRRATAYQIIATAKISIGIEVLSKSVYITALNLYGKKENKKRYKIEFQTSDDYFARLQELVSAFIDSNGYSDEQILGIGLGMQSLTAPDGQTITYGKILDCNGLSIRSFSKYFSVPCKFIHDSECASASELWENEKIKDAIYLSLGYHLGGAIIVDRILHVGLSGKSGTFEHMTLIPNGRECYCGKKGCAESYCSGAYLLDSDANMDLDDFFAKKEQGDPALSQKWNDYLDYLSMLINNLHMVIESTIVLGGRIASYFSEDDLTYIRQNVRNRSAFADEPSYIIQGNCRDDAVSIGAALPFIKSFLEEIASLS